MTLDFQLPKLDVPAEQAYAKLKAADSLPSPSGVAQQVLRLTTEEDTAPEGLVAVLESDPAMADRILRFANSPATGAPRRIVSVSQAAALLGERTVKGVALGVSLVFGQKRVPCFGFAYEPFWSESVGRAVSARQLGELLGTFAPQEAFCCGLLSQIGRLALATAYPGAYGHVLARANADDREELARLERDMFDIDHNQLGAKMMADWGLPAECWGAVQNQELVAGERPAPKPLTTQLTRILRLADLIAVILAHTETSLETINRLVGEAESLGLGEDALGPRFDSIAEEWRRVVAIFGVSGRRVAAFATLLADAASAAPR